MSLNAVIFWDAVAAPVVYGHKGHNDMDVGRKDARLYLYDRDKHTLIDRKDLARRLNDTVMPVRGVPFYVCLGFIGGAPTFDPPEKSHGSRRRRRVGL